MKHIKLFEGWKENLTAGVLLLLASCKDIHSTDKNGNSIEPKNLTETGIIKNIEKSSSFGPKKFHRKVKYESDLIITDKNGNIYDIIEYSNTDNKDLEVGDTVVMKFDNDGNLKLYSKEGREIKISNSRHQPPTGGY